MFLALSQKNYNTAWGEKILALERLPQEDYDTRMKLIIIRHGQTNANVEGRLQGQRINEPLNAEGLRESYNALPDLSQHNITALYTSPILRVYQTAELISKKLRLPLNVRDELAERDFGSLSGHTWEEIGRLGHPGFRAADKALVYDYRPFGGESNHQVRLRIRKLLRDLFALHPNNIILCATHGGIIRILYDELKVKQPEHTPTASLYIFELSRENISKLNQD